MVAAFKLLLEGRTLTAKAISEHCGLERTGGLRRLDLLRTIPGAITTPGPGGSVALPKLLAREAVTANGVAALCLASGLATAFEGTPLADALVRLRHDWVNRSKQGYATEDLHRKFWFVVRGGESALPTAATRLGEVVEAILASEEISFDYRHFDGKRDRISSAEPLTLALHEHQFYVIARRERARPHPFRFSRMSNVRKGKKFEYPSDDTYDPRRAFQNVFGIFIGQQEQPIQCVRLRFSNNWSTYLKSHRWHETQESVRQNDDGSVDVELRVRVCHELRRWVLGFGAEVEVLAPAVLRQEVATALRVAAERYEGAVRETSALSAGAKVVKARPPAKVGRTRQEDRARAQSQASDK